MLGRRVRDDGGLEEGKGQRHGCESRGQHGAQMVQPSSQAGELPDDVQPY